MHENLKLLGTRINSQKTSSVKPSFTGDWKQVFGKKYEVPKAISEMLPDQSHMNTLCPSFLVGHLGDVEVTLWVEHPDFNERVTDRNGRLISKEQCQPSRFFFLCVDTKKGDCWGALETDNEEFAVRHAKAMREFIASKKIPGTKAQPTCPMCGEREMASMGTDIICSKCNTKCGEVA